MADLENELLALADTLHRSHDPDEAQGLRGAVLALAPRARALPVGDAVRGLYDYLDYTSRTNVDDWAAGIRREHAEIETQLLGAIHGFRRAQFSVDVDLPTSALAQAHSRIEALAPESALRSALMSLFAYARRLFQLASQRQADSPTRSLDNSRHSTAERDAPTYRPPRTERRDIGYER
ncbi:hypothetical protein ACIP5Y_22930 [Nocardia sp. NPDC088792]|uniref:hypothetical protein n=1 Tax=Nocardia sp. NPDC088792 TaxID=3364332 RepID=UPI00382D510B